jgi:gas vesicle protein GvpO
MAEQTTDRKRQQRKDARERRRSLASEPFEQLDEAARKTDGSGSGARALKQALATAAAGAVAAGIAGAAKALHDRHEAESEQTPPESSAEQDEDASDPKPQAEDPHWGEQRTAEDDEATAEPREADEPVPDDEATAEPREADEPVPDDEATAEPSAQADEPPADDDAGGPEQQQDDVAAEKSQDETDVDGSGEPDQEQARGAPAGDVKAIVDQARRQAQEVLGLEPESVSGFERKNDEWTVTVEVVEMRRIPESTDVLASYDVTLDEDGNLIGATQRRRYRRSQAEEAS